MWGPKDGVNGHVRPAADRVPRVTPEEIFHLLETADNFLKYGADQRAIDRARKRYGEALAAAEEAGIGPLVEQAKRRLEDLDKLRPGD